MRRLLGLIALLVAPALSSGAAVAQDAFPTKPVAIINPFAPGGGTDVASRAIADKLTTVLGKPVIVENRPGGDGILGTQLLAKARPDGHTIGIIITATLAFNPSIYKAATYDPVREFEPIALIARARFALTVNPKFPARDFKEFVEYVKANPGKVNYASAATTGLVVASLLKKELGLEMNIIPYNGSGAAVADMLAGRVDAMISNPVALLEHIKADKLRALAIMSGQRYAFLPEVATLAELGYDRIDVTGWYALGAPAGTPPEIVDRLSKAINEALQMPEVQRALANSGVEAVTDGPPPSEVKAYIAKEVDFWSDVIKGAGVVPK